MEEITKILLELFSPIIDLIYSMAYSKTGLTDLENRVYVTARQCGLTDIQAKIIVSQCYQESSLKGIPFASNVFKTDNNPVGMKMPSRRPKTYIDRASTIVMTKEGTTPYAHYSSLENAIKDLIYGWHGYNKTNWNTIQSPSDYAYYLKSKGYMGDNVTNYLNGLTNKFNKIKNL